MSRMPEQGRIAHNSILSDSEHLDRMNRESKARDENLSTSAKKNDTSSWNVIKTLWQWLTVSKAHSVEEDSGLFTWTTDESDILSEVDARSEVEEGINYPGVPKVEDQENECKHDTLTELTINEALSSSVGRSCGGAEPFTKKGKTRECPCPKRRKNHQEHSPSKRLRRTHSVATQTSDTELFDDLETMVLALWTPLLLFDMENRDRITAENPATTKYNEITKKLSEAYASLDPNEKEAYTNPTEQLIDKWYKRELSKKKRFQAGGKGYIVFATEAYQILRAAHPSFTVIEINRYLGQQWTAMDRASKQKYVKKWNSRFSSEKRETV